MKKENKILMSEAREALKGKWGLAIGTFVVYLIIFGAISGITGFIIPLKVGNFNFGGNLITIIIAGPFALGMAIFSLSLSRKQDAKLEMIFEGFKTFGTALGAYLLVAIFTILWALLLIVPGIIAAISYGQTFYIIADDKSIGIMEAINKSKKMMYGYKWKYFCLGLRFFGWSLLCILSLGIGFLWLIPYIQVSMAKFYDDVKEIATDANEVAPEVA